MRVIITGATGFIGSHVVSELVKRKIKTLCLGRHKCVSPHSDFVKCDLLAQPYCVRDIFEEFKPTHLIHLAWVTEHGTYWNSSLNLDWLSASNHLVSQFCQSGGQHVVAAGTCAEYDWRYGYCVEDLTPLNSTSSYGLMKNVTRQSIEDICRKHDVGLAWTRIFFPYGEGESSQRLIPSLFRVCRGEEQPFGINFTSYRDMLHVADAAGAITLCSENSVVGTFNISSGQPASLGYVLKCIAKLCDYSPDKIFELQSSRPHDSKFIVGSNAKIEALGWKMKIPLLEGLRNYEGTKI